ncbi:carbohydrate-binding family 9-like protein [Parapedobacter lycopersici]|uniref:carbohydrate-binding family 9-like protein n=1 Tax=Parapedobacter lycopersici TaxID=1864939 RepID=UPI00214D29A3|nr:carbohydrate-binding family 9-like protein [Parapedobacter lycopersici]
MPGVSLYLNRFVQLVFVILSIGPVNAIPATGVSDDVPLSVPKVEDFELTGTGSHPVWEAVSWQSMTKLDDGGTAYASKFKICYSNTGIYVLFEGEDRRITTVYDEDFGELWNGDVFEVFFHPDTDINLSGSKNGMAVSYVEYEINPLNRELVLFISRKDGQTRSGFPERYEGARRVRKAVNVALPSSGAEGEIVGWSAEMYFPFTLLADGGHTVPVSGTVWHANFCRIDYDSGTQVKWSWTPGIKHSFHELAAFLTITFE